MSTSEESKEGKPSETQIGAIGEAIIAARLALDSGGRLMPFSPIADDGGIDLLVHDRMTGTSWPIQVKTRTKTLTRSPNGLHFEVRRATFNAWPNAFLLAAYVTLDDGTLGVRRAWLIPMRELPKVARTNEKKYVIRPSWSATSKDRYTRFRCETMADVATRLLGV